MATTKDAQIWCNGIVQYAMSSGKFEAHQIEELAQQAFQSFVNLFGVPRDDGGYAVPPRLMPDVHPAANQAAAPRNATLPQAPEPGEVDGKPFRLWGGDKIRLGKKIGIGGKPWGEVTWAEAYRALVDGSDKVGGYLSFLANIKDNDPQYAKANSIMRGRAQALLDAAPERAQEEMHH